MSSIHHHEKCNFHSCLTQASVHGRPLWHLYQGDVFGTHFFGHVQNINSGTSSGAGFMLFHLMQIESFSTNSQPFPIGVGISELAVRHFFANVRLIGYLSEMKLQPVEVSWHGISCWLPLSWAVQLISK